MEDVTHPKQDHIILDFCLKRLSPPSPVKLFMGIISSQAIDLLNIKNTLSSRFGQLDVESPVHTFNHSDYYAKEMGQNLNRCFLGFKKCVNPENLAEIKLLTNRMEAEMGLFDGTMISRLVNIDPGILTLSSVILATTKNRAHRIYLGHGIFAEVTLIYSKKTGWQTLNWTYPDYRTQMAIEFFQTFRDHYHAEFKNHL